jgi:hypothetical protein
LDAASRYTQSSRIPSGARLRDWDGLGDCGGLLRHNGGAGSVTTTYAVPAALGGGPITATRIYASTKDLLLEVEAARIYGGMHYHHSVVQGAVLGKKVARQLRKDFFQPLDGSEMEEPKDDNVDFR